MLSLLFHIYCISILTAAAFCRQTDFSLGSVPLTDTSAWNQDFSILVSVQQQYLASGIKKKSNIWLYTQKTSLSPFKPVSTTYRSIGWEHGWREQKLASGMAVKTDLINVISNRNKSNMLINHLRMSMKCSLSTEGSAFGPVGYRLANVSWGC